MQNSTTFKFAVIVPQRVTLSSAPDSDSDTSSTTQMDREEFYEWIWARFSKVGLVGVHEGTLLTPQAEEQGLEPDSWVVDAGVVPTDRDWVGNQKKVSTELYFTDQGGATHAAFELSQIQEIAVGPVEEQLAHDWDAEWKASFLELKDGVIIPPCWRVIPPWVEAQTLNAAPHEKLLRINPGAGFGTGTHETTQLCLQALGEAWGGGGESEKSEVESKKSEGEGKSLRGQRVLDFGSGSGILAISMAHLGAIVDAVEVDPLALDNAHENASLNGFGEAAGKGPGIRFQNFLPHPVRQYACVVANILKPVLLEYAQELKQRLHPEGILILSGLVESDVEPILKCYQTELGLTLVRTMEKGEWRGLVFRF